MSAGVATPHQQRLIRPVAFRFARRRSVLPCVSVDCQHKGFWIVYDIV